MNALVTVTSQNYLAGTKVLFHSFIQNNPSSNCDLLVVHDGLDKSCQKELEDLFPVKLIEVSYPLKAAVADLVQQLPEYRNKVNRFWSIESFNFKQYQKLLFLDSDTLIRGQIDQLFDIESAFSACLDRSAHSNKVRDKVTFQKRETGANVFDKVFNSGVFLINNLLVNSNAYQDLIHLLRADVLAPVSTGHTDQFLLNTYFYGKTRWLNSEYNCLLRSAIASDASNNALIWHYLRHPKPWILRPNLYRRLKLRTTSPFIREWQMNYRKILMREIKLKMRPRFFIYWLYSKFVC